MGRLLQTPIEGREIIPEEEEGGGGGGGGNGGTTTFFTCEICIEPVAASSRFRNQNICSHPFCQDCIAKYIEVKVQDDYTAKIECPGLDCERNLDIFTCKPIIPSSVFVKWCDLLCDEYLLGFERCYCPNEKCVALVVNECGRNVKVKKAKCPSCKEWFCFHCNLKWHAGYRCEESGNLRDQNDIVFGQLVEKMKWARCPGCGHCVQRVKGCFSVLCRFCYECGRRISSSGCLCTPPRIEHNCSLLVLTIAALVTWIVIIVITGGRKRCATSSGQC